jgi:hypothetical protein
MLHRQRLTSAVWGWGLPSNWFTAVSDLISTPREERPELRRKKKWQLKLFKMIPHDGQSIDWIRRNMVSALGVP